ncbi:MAG TPA: host attachment protein [Kofleriaceae bacterium]|jgi:protein required for attachment to host cells
MYRAFIVIADAARARLFTLERSNDGEGTKEVLREHDSMIDPERRQRPSKQAADHRQSHNAELDAEFARMIARETSRRLRDDVVSRLVICAGPHMLGHLRHALESLPASIHRDEIARNFIELSPSELRLRLAEHDILPPPPSRQSTALQ